MLMIEIYSSRHLTGNTRLLAQFSSPKFSNDRFSGITTGKIGKYVKVGVFLFTLVTILFGVYTASQDALNELQKVDCPKCQRYLSLFGSTPLAYYALPLTLGIISGFTPCLIALILMVIGTAFDLGESSRRVILKVVFTVGGVFYAYLIIPNLILLVPSIVQKSESVTIVLGASLLILGIAHSTEAARALYKNEWMIHEDNGILLSKTPRALKNMVKKTLTLGNLYIYFLVGAFLAVVKLFCVGSLMLVSLPLSLSQPSKFVMSIVLFDLGLILPITLISLLTCLGLTRVGHLTALRLRSQLIQRAVVGIALILAGLILILNSDLLWSVQA